MADRPKNWDHDELRDKEAIDSEYGEMWPLSTLTNTPHTIFDQERWKNHEGQQLSDVDYETLLPSIKLASRFLEVGIDYLANFLPSSKLHQKLNDDGVVPELLVNNEENYNDLYTIPIKAKGTYNDEEVEDAIEELTEIAEMVTWRLNRSIVDDATFMGVTRLLPPPSDRNEPWDEPSKVDVLDADKDAKDQGYSRRLLTVGIMQEYLDNLKIYAKRRDDLYARSELLRATFLCGYTMAHEVAHVVWSQDFRCLNYNEVGQEPYCGDDAQSELGRSFMSWIFGGFDPNLDEVRSLGSVDFSQHLVWSYQPKKNERWPKYQKLWAIPLPYLSSLFDDKTWTEPGDIDTQEGRRSIMEGLRPDMEELPYCASTKSKAAYERARDPDRRQLMEEDVVDMLDIDDDDRAAEPAASAPSSDGEDEEDELAPSDFRRPLELEELPEFLPLREPLDAVGLGVAWQDVSDEGLTMLKVHYKPRVTQSAAAKLPAGRGNLTQITPLVIGDEDNAAANEDWRERFGNEKYDCRDVVAVLTNKTVEAVANFTHRGAYNYARKHGISCWKRCVARKNSAWGDCKLNPTDGEDRHFIEMIRQFSFNQAERRFKDNVSALNEIRQARMASIYNLTGREDLVDISRGLGVRPAAGDSVASIRSGILEAYVVEAKRWAESTERLIDSGESQPRLNNTFQEKLQLVYSWTAQDLEIYEQSKDVPVWGSVATRIKRTQRKMIEDRWGPVDRYRANQDSTGPTRRTKQGIESYVFGLIPRQTTVVDVKGWLFDCGFFPANSIMHLFLGRDRRREMEDSSFLSDYEPTDWRDVWLYVDLQGPPQTTTPAQEKPAVYTPHNLLLPGSDRSPKKKRRAEYFIENGKKYRKVDDDEAIEQEGDYTIDANGTVFEVLEYDFQVENAEFLRRLELLGRRTNGEEKDPIDPLPLKDRTDLELVARVAAKQEALKRGFLKFGGHANPLKQGAARSQKSNDILEIADTFDDIDEAEEASNKAMWDIEDAMNKVSDGDDGRILGHRPVASGNFVLGDIEDPFAPTSVKETHMSSLYKVVMKSSYEELEDKDE